MNSEVSSHVLSSRVSLFHPSVKSTHTNNTQSKKLWVLVESEKSSKTPQVEFARSLFGELKAKTVYVASANGQELIVLMPADGPKKLAGHEFGQSHLASSWGGALSACLGEFHKQSEPLGVSVMFSEAAEKTIAKSKKYFLASLVQRGISNKLVNGKQKKGPIQCALSPEQFEAQTVEDALVLSESMTLTRSLINMPANILGPEGYETFVRQLVREECSKQNNPNFIRVDVYGFERLGQENCGLIRAVGKGSAELPRIIKLTYAAKPSDKPARQITLVGKGITFDTGGLDIKGSGFMRNMKKDMGGSAAALGIFMCAARSKIKANVTCYLSVAENAVSGTAMRPGDVYTARNGLKVEIDNTDAEGRLVLADALCLATEEKPDWIIDLATLTGASRTALGPMVDSLFCSDRKIESLVFQSGLETGDWVWPMPLVDDYESMFDSTVGDCMNSATSGMGGAITAALFLRKFVGQTPWSHIDTYMWADKASDIVSESGANPKCVRLIMHAMETFLGDTSNGNSKA